MFEWDGGRDVQLERPKIYQWPLVIIRVILIACVVFPLMVPLLICRAVGADAWGQVIVRLACKACLRIIGLRVLVHGAPMPDQGAVVANHSSWLDIFTLNSAMGVYFVSKADVAGWPLIGSIAKSTGTVFIERRTSQAGKHKNIFMDRIARGHRLLFFPEGTSTDGRRVLKFRSSLFAAFFATKVDTAMWVQPVSANYHAPSGARKDFYGWWGEMSFFSHFTMILSRWRQGRIELVFHQPLNVQDFETRKALAASAESAVRDGLNVS